MPDHHATEVHRETILPEWVDYNGHMNVAYYVLVFDRATDAFLDTVGVTQTRRDKTGDSVFVAEQHVTYDREVMEGEDVYMTAQVLGADTKRLHVFLTMHHATSHNVCATTDIMILSVNLNDRRVGPFPDDIQKAVFDVRDADASLPSPEKAGRSVGLPRPR